MTAALARFASPPSLGISIDALASTVARAWCRSFGLAGGPGQERLERRLVELAAELLAAGTAPADMRRALDHSAEHLIRAWFASILGEDDAPASVSSAVVRLAFLDANAGGRWSDAFLSPEVDRPALHADLRAHMIVPVPPIRLRPIARQPV